MDGTEQVDIGPAEVEFSRQFGAAYKKADLDGAMRRVRDEALIGTIKKYADKLDFVAVERSEHDPIKMVYKIQDDLFFDPESDFFLKASYPQPKTQKIFIVNPLSTEDLTSQWVQQILMCLSEKVKTDDHG